MDDRESLLKAIFAHPEDDLPRLVFADYLQEQGEIEWSELIRISCELAKISHPNPLPDTAEGQQRRQTLLELESSLRDRIFPATSWHKMRIHRGFLKPVRNEPATIAVSAMQLDNPDIFRHRALFQHPEWYGCTHLAVIEGRLTSAHITTILDSPVCEKVTTLHLNGRTIETPITHPVEGETQDNSDLVLPVADIDIQPTLTLPVLETLCQSRQSRRLIELNLTDNNLDNDALRALARSPHLIRLRRLYLTGGNRFRGRPWQQVYERFGPDVVY